MSPLNESTPLAERFTALRKLLSTSAEFVVPWDYFHDKMASQGDFLALGQLEESVTINIVLEAALRKYGLVGRPQSMITCHIAEYAFWHGLRHFDSKLVVFFFDVNIGQGLLGIMKDLTHGSVDLCRLTTVSLAEGPAFPMRPTRNRSPE